MSDLQEIQRFWPRAVPSITVQTVYVPSRRPVGFYGFSIGNAGDEGWLISDWRNTNKDFTWWTGPSIAAAMAAAGFAVRKVGKWRSLRLFLEAENRHPWDPENWKPYKTPLQSRQRPRKGVRLGRRGRRLALAASIGEALDLVRQKRLDRGEVAGE